MDGAQVALDQNSSTIIIASVVVELLVLAMVGRVGVVRRGGPMSKVIGLTMLGAIAAGLVWVVTTLPMGNA